MALRTTGVTILTANTLVCLLWNHSPIDLVTVVQQQPLDHESIQFVNLKGVFLSLHFNK